MPRQLKRLATVLVRVAAIVSVAVLCAGEVLGQEGVSVTYRLVGAGARVLQERLTVPRGLPTHVDVVVEAGVVTGAVVGRLVGPSLPAPLELRADAGQPLLIPAFAKPGIHFLEDIRLVVDEQTSIPATPSTVTINVLDEFLVSEVTSRPLTLQEIRDRGIVFDTSSYQAFQFTLAMTTESRTVPIQLPVLVPTVDTLPPIVLEWDRPAETIPGIQNMSIAGVMLKPELVGAGGGDVPPIPGILVIPGNVQFLNQFFSVMLVVSNRAPDGTPLVVRGLTAEIALPTGADGVMGDLRRDPPFAPGDPEFDNPLRVARTAAGRETVKPVRSPGADGVLGTADDGDLLPPQGSSQAEFLVEGVREGGHTIDLRIRGTLDGLPGGPVQVSGLARGAVVVRDPDFNLTFIHPDVVRAGQRYDLTVQVHNTSSVPANLVRITLDPRNMSGARLMDAAQAAQEIDTIAAGESGTFTFSLESMRTGRVTATSLDLHNADGIVGGRRFSLRTGVTDEGVPLSPDTLLLPAASGTLRDRSGNPDLTFRALALIGEAYSIANAPFGSLPASVRRIAGASVVDYARQVGAAGLRLELHQRLRADGTIEPVPDSLLLTVEDLFFDMIGVRTPDTGWDALYRRSRQARLYGVALADVVSRAAPEAGVEDLIALQRHWADTESYRGAHVSVMTQSAGSAVPVVVTLRDLFGRSVGGSLDPPAGRFELPGADILHFRPSTLGTGHFAIATSPQSDSYTATLAATETGTFDLGVVVPDADGVLHQIVFTAVSVTAGEALTLRIARRADALATLERGTATIAASSTVAIPDRPPSVLGVMQQADVNVDVFGRAVAVLFDQDVERASAEVTAGYRVSDETIALAPPPLLVDGNRTSAVLRQYGNRVVLVGLRDPVGPFVPRTIDVSGVKDLQGAEMAPAVARPVLADPDRGAGAHVSGRIRAATGLPAAGVEVSYLQERRILGILCGPVVISQKTADEHGGYNFDFVVQDSPECTGAPFRVRVRDPRTGAQGELATRVRADGERMTLDLTLLGRGVVTGTVRNGAGQPVPNADVRLVSETDVINADAVRIGGGDGHAITTRTDQDGVYRFQGVPVGAIGLEASVRAGADRGSVRATGLVAGDGSTTTIDLQLGAYSAAAIDGIVRSSDGSSTQGLSVYLGDRDGLLLDRSTTGEGGAFRFERVPIGEVIVRVINRGSAADARVTIDTSHSADNPAHVLLLLSGAGSVSGTITRRSGTAIAPVAGARVSGPMGSVVTDTGGRYVLPTVPVGAQTIGARDPVSGDTGSTTVTVLHAGYHATGIDIVIEGKGTITGRILDPDGQAIGGQTVRLVLGGGPISPTRELYSVRSTVTNGDGRYTFTGVEFGEYPVTAVRGREAANGRAAVGPLVPVAEVDLRLERPMARISGRVVDETGVGVAAQVTLAGRAPDSAGILRFKDAATIVSDPDRGFTFDRVYFGPFTVTAGSFFSPGGASATASGVTSEAAPTADGITLTLGPNTARLRGCLLAPDGSPLAPILDGTGTPRELPVFISSARLRDQLARDTHNPEPEGIRVDGSGGCYVSSIPLPADDYTIRFTDLRDGSPTYGLTGEAHAEVPRAKDVVQDVRLLGLGTLQVEVVDRGGVHVPGVSIAVRRTTYPRDGGETFQTTPTDVGPAVFAGLTEGVVSVSARVSTDPLVDVGGRNELRGFGGHVTSTVIRGGNVTARVVLDAAGIVSGRFVAVGGDAPVPNAQVELEWGRRPFATHTAFAVTDVTGAFRFDGIPTAPFTLRGIDPMTGRRATTQGAVTHDGQHAVLDLRLGPLGTVRGVVVGHTTSEPVAGAEVTLQIEGQTRLRHLTTGADGLFEFPSVPGGAFTVTAVDGGGITGRVDETLTTEGQRVEVVVLLEGSGRVEGIVRDASGAPVGGASVVVVDATGRQRSAQTTTTGPGIGRYSVSPLPLGAFSVRARPAGAITPGDGGVAAGMLTGNGETATADVTFIGTISLGVVVQGAIGPSAVTVSATVDGPFGGLAAPASVGGGVSLFDGVPRAPLVVSASQMTPAGIRISASRALAIDELPPSGTRLAPDLLLTLSAAGTIRGTVTNPDGGVVPGARVTLVAGSLRVFTLTTLDGAYEFQGVPLGVTVRLDAAIDGNVASFTGAIDASGVVLDAAGTALEAVPLVLDVDAPRVVSVTPADASVNVSTTLPIVLFFSEPISLASLRACGTGPAVGPPNLRLLDTTNPTFDPRDPGDPCDDSNVVRATLALSLDGLTLTVTPAVELAGLRRYTVVASPGEPGTDGVLVNGITDLVGRSLEALFAASFVTRDNVPPAVLLVSPAHGAVDVPADSVVRVTLSEPIDPATIAGVVVSTTAGAVSGRRDLILGGTVIVFTPTLPDGTRAYLHDNATYTVTVAGLRDVSGNVLAAPVQAAFRTHDTVAPSVESISAPPNAREGSTVRIVVIAPDADVASVELVVNGALAAVSSTAAAPGTYQFDVTMPNKAISVSARAVDASGNIGPLAPAVTVALLADPYVRSILPESTAQGSVVPFTLVGANTTFKQGTSVVDFGIGISVSDVAVTSPTTLGGRITVAGDAPLGPRVVTVITGSEVARLEGATFTVTPAIAQIETVTPNNLEQGLSAAVTITARATQFASGTTQVSFGAGVVVKSVTVLSPTVLRASVAVDVSATVGARDVVVTTGSQTLTRPGAFSVTPGSPMLESITPSSGKQGETLTVALVMRFTDFVTHPPTVSLGDGITTGTISVNSATSLTVPITIADTAVAGPRDLTLVLRPGRTLTVRPAFTVTAATVPTLLGVSPESGAAGEAMTVAITGQFTNFVQGQSVVSMGVGISVSDVLVASATRLTASVVIAPEATLGARDVSVSTGAETATQTAGFTVRPAGSASLNEAVSNLLSIRVGPAPESSLPPGLNEAVTALLSARNGSVPPPSLPTGQNEAVSALVSVGVSAGGSLDGVREATSALVSVRNGAAPPPSLPTGLNEAVSPLLSLRNGAAPVAQLPAGLNEAVSVMLSLRNGAVPGVPTGLNEAVSSLLSVGNFGTSPMSLPSDAKARFGASPGEESVSAPGPDDEVERGTGGPETAGMTIVVTAGDDGVAVSGQTLELGVRFAEDVAVRRVAFFASDTELGETQASPWRLWLLVPSEVSHLHLRAVAHLDDGTTMESAVRTVTVLAAGSITFSGSVVDDAGAPIQGARVWLQTRGLSVDAYETETLEQGADLSSVVPDRQWVVSSPALRNPGFVFGPDPLGTGLAPGYLARLGGMLRVPVAGEYTLSVSGHKTARLFVNGVPVLDTRAPGADPARAERRVLLPEGDVPFGIEFVDEEGPAALVVSWTRPDGVSEAIGPAMLRSDVVWLSATTDEAGRYEIVGASSVLDGIRVRVQTGDARVGESDAVTLSPANREAGAVTLAPIVVKR